MTLTFRRNGGWDKANPIHGTVGLFERERKRLAGNVLADPLVGKPPSVFRFLNRWDLFKWGEVIEREEFIRILLGLASTDPDLRALLAQNGIPEPERALDDIRQAAQRLEAENPQAASHDRLSQAILEGARSPFVGRINAWFDQTMDRTTSEYKFRAQLVTVGAALLVASVVQMDSIDLLRRLSTDDKLRESLVTQAQQQQARIDDQDKKPPEKQNQEEVQLAKARRDEIEANLAKLRDPQLSVIPDHFIWQPLPRARLMRNDAEWSKSRPPQRMELVLGSSIFPLEPRWSSDMLADIEDAIVNSGAPVTLSHDSRDQYTVTSYEHGPSVDRLQIRLRGSRATGVINRTLSLATTSLKNPRKAPPAALFLVVGYEPHDKIDVAAPLNLANLVKALKVSHAGITVKFTDGNPPDIILTATKPETRWIELLTTDEDPASNIMKPVWLAGGSAIYDAQLGDKDPCDAVIEGGIVEISPCSADTIHNVLTNTGFAVTHPTATDYLVLTSHRLGTVQLRAVPGKSESNILNRAEEWSCDCRIWFDQDLFSQSWRGILLTWVLLSLGAPFWYDALKDLLKLRSTLAKKEEDARKERETTTPPPTAAKPAK